MIVETFKPSSLLSAFVEKYVIVAMETERINRLLPGTSITMAFRLYGQTEYIRDNTSATLPASIISGLRKTPRFVKYSANSSTLIVLFRTSGAMAFFRDSLHSLFEESLALDEVIDRSAVHRVEDQLSGCSSHDQRIEVVEQFLSSQLRYSQDPMITTALSRISAANGNIKIKSLADSLHLSQDAFEKRFRKVVGGTAKQVSTIMRLKSVLSHPQVATSVTDLALTAGYFDSSHFNKDFKLFTGQTPKEFFSVPPAW